MNKRRQKTLIICLIIIVVIAVVGLIIWRNVSSSTSNPSPAPTDNLNPQNQLEGAVIDQRTGRPINETGPYQDIAGQYDLDVPAGTKLDGLFLIAFDADGYAYLQSYDRSGNRGYIDREGQITAFDNRQITVTLADGSQETFTLAGEILTDSLDQNFKHSLKWADKYRFEAEQQQRLGNPIPQSSSMIDPNLTAPQLEDPSLMLPLGPVN